MVTFEESMKIQKDIMDQAADFMKKASKGAKMMAQPPNVKVGQTPHEIVYRKHKAKLIRYAPMTEKVYETPILITYALVNKPYVMDLLPGRSVVEVLVKAGFQVFMLDWGEPTMSDSKKGLDVYINTYIDKMVDKVCELTGSEQVNLLGYCMGGTMAMMYTALHPDKVKNLATMASPFSNEINEGLLFEWTREFPIEELVERYGNVPGWYLNMSFGLLKPLDKMDKALNFYNGILDDGFTELFLAMERWSADSIDVPGQAYLQFVKAVFQENTLVSNTFHIAGKHVDMKNIRCPYLNMVALKDTLVPPDSSLKIGEYTGSEDYKLLTCDTGHIGLSVSGKALKKTWGEAVQWLGERSGGLK